MLPTGISVRFSGGRGILRRQNTKQIPGGTSMQIRLFRFACWTAVLSLGVVAVTVFGAEVERPFGPTDPFRPYDQPMPNTPETTAYHEGLYLHADVGISLMRDTSSIKTDPGARFSFGPGYTLHSSEL